VCILLGGIIAGGETAVNQCVMPEPTNKLSLILT
jgi:hypothetical protein